ncbi:hypothetical protein GCM10023149_21330 [Mucilaginibacter gynuensis]|uniref:Lumazine-binding protein n=2 Tax=Mucilaginibacter gynuensis TaxID=1302236 RepID=A0ABP8GCK8_9SPHI
MLVACNRNGSHAVTGADTTDVLNAVLHSEKIVEDMYKIPDTIFFIKTKKGYYNSSWPLETGKIKISYIDETPAAVKRIERSNKLNAKPLRYIVTSFSIDHDSSKIVIHGINQLTDYSYRLRKKDGKWSVVDHTFSIE